MTIINGYEQSDREEALEILNLPSLEKRAEDIIRTFRRYRLKYNISRKK